jgi:hypothetical protein
VKPGSGQKHFLRSFVPRLYQTMASGFQCAGCGEWNETAVDSSAGQRQQYVEDCQVCCQANVLRVTWDGELEEFLISAQLE